MARPRIAVFVGAVAALSIAVPALAQDADERPVSAHRQGEGTTVTLAAGRREIVFGSSSRLRGSVKNGDAPAAQGTPVEIQADPFPYDSYATVGTAATGPDGGFSHRVEPDRNTRYRAVAAGGTSKQRTVFTDVRGDYRRTARGGGRYRHAVTLTGPADLPYAGRRMWFYRLGDGGRRARRVAGAPLRELGPGRVRASAVLRLRNPRALYVCTREKTPDAWGRAYPIDRACGARRLSR